MRYCTKPVYHTIVLTGNIPPLVPFNKREFQSEKNRANVKLCEYMQKNVTMFYLWDIIPHRKYDRLILEETDR